MTSRACLFFAIITFALTAGATLAHAQGEDKAAKAHADRALREYNLGHFTAAIAAYEQAYALDPAPALLFNIATAHRKNGTDEKAIFFYERYLDQLPDAPNRSDVKARIRELKDKLARQKAAQASAAVTPPPAQVTPPVPAPTPVVPLPSAPADEASYAPAPPAALTPDTASDPARPARTAAWIAAGGAALGLGVGVAFHIAGVGMFSQFDQYCGVDQNNVVAPRRDVSPMATLTRCQALDEAWRADRTWAITGYVAGGTLALTSAVLFAISGRSASSTTGTQAAISCAPGPGLLFCRGAF